MLRPHLVRPAASVTARWIRPKTEVFDERAGRSDGSRLSRYTSVFGKLDAEADHLRDLQHSDHVSAGSDREPPSHGDEVFLGHDEGGYARAIDEGRPRTG